MVEVRIGREPVGTEMEVVKCCSALEDRTVYQVPVPRNSLQQVKEPQHLLQCLGLVTGLVGRTPLGLGGMHRDIESLEATSDDVYGKDDVPAPLPDWCKVHVEAMSAGACKTLREQHKERPAVSARTPAGNRWHRRRWPCPRPAGSGGNRGCEAALSGRANPVTWEAESARNGRLRSGRTDS